MKRILLFVTLLFPILLWGEVQVSISDGISDGSVKTKMERNMSALLTEINNAQAAGRAINFAQLGINSSVQLSLSMLWENSPFICIDEVVVERCLTTNTGYQVRNIPLEMRPREKNFNESEYQEAVFNFDKQGNVENFYFSISMNLYMNVIKNNLEITDHRRRQLILDYVEQFRTAYNKKDIKFLEQVFSDDALIITGTVIKQKPADGIVLPDKIKYEKHTKQEYINRLRGIFARNSYIKVSFDEIKVMKHPVNANYYGVTLHQGYKSSTYSDDGYLFLLWDFTDEQAPKIHVRTWQPDMLNGGRLSEDEIFSLDDFDI